MSAVALGFVINAYIREMLRAFYAFKHLNYDLFSNNRNEDHMMAFCESILMFNGQIYLLHHRKASLTHGIRWDCAVKKIRKGTLQGYSYN